MEENQRLRLLVEKINREKLGIRVIGEGLPLVPEERKEK